MGDEELLHQSSPMLGFTGTEVWLVRHGRSEGLAPDANDTDNPPLHAEGHEQAKRLAARIAGIELDAVYSSTMARAVQTAEAMLQGRDLALVQREEWCEIDLGDWRGGGYRKNTSDMSPLFLEFVMSGRWETIPNAEQDDAFRARIRGALDRVLADHEGQRVAIVCHGGVIGGIVADVHNIHRSTPFPIENTSVTVIRDVRGHKVVSVLNDHAHLRDPLNPHG